jgi:hypothetical protein
MGSLFAVRVYPPFQLDVSLMSKTQFGPNELADEPTGATHLIHRGVAEIKRSFAIHTRPFCEFSDLGPTQKRRRTGRFAAEISEVEHNEQVCFGVA